MGFLLRTFLSQRCRLRRDGNLEESDGEQMLGVGAGGTAFVGGWLCWCGFGGWALMDWGNIRAGWKSSMQMRVITGVRQHMGSLLRSSVSPPGSRYYDKAWYNVIYNCIKWFLERTEESRRCCSPHHFPEMPASFPENPLKTCWEECGGFDLPWSPFLVSTEKASAAAPGGSQEASKVYNALWCVTRADGVSFAVWA